jgi:nitrogen permease regulator 2-like protein
MTDLTLSKIIPQIDGVASVAHIAEQSDVDLSLARKAVAHLLYYNCVLLLDIFSFSAQYAVSPDFSAFVEDAESQEEAVRYVTTGQYRKLTDSERLSESRLTDSGTVGGGSRPPESHHDHGPGTDVWGWKAGESGLSRAQLVEIYASLKPGLSLRNWCLERNALLAGLDVRRLVTFGVIKGFLYRCHRYAVLDDASSPLDQTEISKSRIIRQRIMSRKARTGHDDDKALLGAEATARRLSRPGSIAGALRDSAVENVNVNNRAAAAEELEEHEEEIPIIYYMDGQHCFDEICTDLCVSEGRAMDKMKEAHKSVKFITR